MIVLVWLEEREQQVSLAKQLQLKNPSYRPTGLNSSAANIQEMLPYPKILQMTICLQLAFYLSFWFK